MDRKESIRKQNGIFGDVGMDVRVDGIQISGGREEEEDEAAGVGVVFCACACAVARPISGL